MGSDVELKWNNMKLMKHCITALFSIIISYTSYAQSESKNTDIKEDSVYHMRNHGVLTFERKVPKCDLVKNGKETSKIVCKHYDGGTNQETKSSRAKKKEKSSAKTNEEDEEMVKNDSKNGFKSGNKKY